MVHGLSLGLKCFVKAAHFHGDLVGLLVMGVEVLDLSSQYGVILSDDGIVNGIRIGLFINDEKFIVREERGVTLNISTSMEGIRVDNAVISISGQEFWEGAGHVIADEMGNYILVAIGDDKVMASVGCHPILFPSWTWVDTRLRDCRARSLPFGISISSFDCGLLCSQLVIENDGHVVVIHGQRSASHHFMRGRNGKWFGTGRGAVGVVGVSDFDKFIAGIGWECVGNSMW